MSKSKKPATWREGQVKDPTAPGRPSRHETRAKTNKPEQTPESDGFSPLLKLGAIQDDIGRIAETMSARHVKFARLVWQGQTQEQAAILCGYSRDAARVQGSTLAARPDVSRLIDLLTLLDCLTAVHVERPAIRLALLRIMLNGQLDADRVRAAATLIKLEGYERVQVEVQAAVTASDPEELRQKLADTLARARAQIGGTGDRGPG